MKRWLPFVLMCLAGSAWGYERPAKKLLEYGWDVPYPDYVRANIRAMEEKPFDGLVFRLNTYNQAFDTTAWTAEQLQPQIDDLKAIEWGKFTDNFLTLYAANKSGMEWDNDAQWEVITNNLRLTAEAAVAGRCVGIVWDPEPYGPNPWTWADKSRPFAEWEKLARRRGAQFITALQGPMPNLRVLTFHQMAMFTGLFGIVDDAKREASLESNSYGLWPAFFNGMLDAAGPGVRLIDGNEASYYYADSDSYYRAYQTVKQRAQVMIDPMLRDKYTAQVPVGVALYVDQVMALRDRKVLSHFMQPAERPLFFEHNTYHALNSTDEYVWLYSEKMNWWKGPIPEGLEAAVVSARQKIAEGKPLGFDLKPIVERAIEAQKAATAARIQQRNARLSARGEAPAPVIDGQLTDPVWQQVAPLEAFVPVAEASSTTPSAKTTAVVTYDADNLYVAMICEEPLPDKIRVEGTRKDDMLWLGDTAELFVSTGAAVTPYRHFMVNPAGVLWDGEWTPDGDDVQWNGEWQGAAHRSGQGWTVEMAIPWSLLGGAPRPGETRRANLCRARLPVNELSCWSTTLRGFVEPEMFGTWTF